MKRILRVALFGAVIAALPAYAAANDYVSTDVPKPLPDVTTTDSTLVVPEALFPTDVNVTISLTHTFDGDLDISLLSPGDAVEVLLSNNRGGSGNNFTGTTFDDGAATPISAGTAPFASSFRPEQPLSAFNGINAQGTWTLRIADTVALDAGTLLGWSLEIVDETTSVPEPATLVLLGGGLVALRFMRRRRSGS